MRFTLFGIPVYIAPTFWIFLLLLANVYQVPLVEGLMVMGIMFLSLLVHECGHALTARHFGAEAGIVLEGWSGGATYDPYSVTPKQRFFITLNGPLFESLLIFIPYFLLKTGVFAPHPFVQYALYVTMKMNIVWCLFNLLPILPLDGGHLLLYFLEKKWGVKGCRATFFLGLVTVVPAALYFWTQGSLFFPVLLLIYGAQNLEAWRYSKEGGAKEGRKKLLKKGIKSKDPLVRMKATESLARLYFEEDETDKSYQLLTKAEPEGLKEGKFLLCKLAFQKGNYVLVAKYAKEVYEGHPSYEVALLNSKAFAHLKDAYYAGAWLETASQFGPAEKREAIKELESSDYDAVREAPAFQEATAHLTEMHTT